MEDAAIDPRALAGTDAGVYVGMMLSEWGALNLLDFPSLTSQRGIGGGHSMVANRVSYHLNLIGPSVTVDTACSSSLTAVHLGCQALAAGDTDLVVACGVNILLTPALSIFYTQAGLSAPDGTCKPFSADADGIGRGEGVGTVVLRRLDDAVADRQPIYSIITGSATNQDGKSSGITAPNRWAQSKVMQRALDRAGATASDVTFVEAHGTGTTLGDMIEANALGDLHRAERDTPCLLGSIKGNIGHTEGAAGIASLIKTSLALSRRVLPPTVAVAGPNPALRLDQQGLALATTAADLGEGPALAGVSSFGIGGSNVHVLLTTPPAATAVREVDHDEVGVITVSAHSSDALRRNATALANALDGYDDDVAAFCYTSNEVKSSLKHRFAVAGTRNELIGALLGYDMCVRTETPHRRGGRLRIGLLCTGQGAQYPGMTQALYRACPPYRKHLTRAAAAVDATFAGPNGLLTSMFRGGDVIDTTEYAQPALFAVSYAIGAALLDLGVEPTFLIGHSVGEFAAAALAEVLTLDEAARLVVARGAVMQQLPTGRCDASGRRPRRTGRETCCRRTGLRNRRDQRAGLDGGVRARRGRRSHRRSTCPRRRKGHLTARLARVPFASHGACAGGTPRYRRPSDAAEGDDPAHLDRNWRDRRRHRHGRRLLGLPAHLDGAIRGCDAYRHGAGVPDPPRRTRPAPDPAGTCAAKRHRHRRSHPGPLRRAGRRRRRLRAGRRPPVQRRAHHRIRPSLQCRVADAETVAALRLR